MNFEKLFIRLFVILSLTLSSVAFTACSEDSVDEPENPSQEEPAPGDKEEEGEGGEEGGEEPETPPQEESKYKPGDDFFTYANAEWLESVEGVQVEGSIGWFDDIDSAVEEYLAAVKTEMPEYAALYNSLANIEANQQAAVDLIKEIASDMVSGIKSKKDAYIAYGKAIRLGIESAGRLYTGIFKEDNTIGYYFLPPMAAAEAEAKINGSRRPSDVITYKTSTKYPRTRAGKTPIDYVLEGIGFDPEYYIYDEISEAINNALSQASYKDLANNIEQVIQSELLLYCFDDYVEEATGGEYESVADHFEQTIENDLGYYTSYYFTNKYITPSLKSTFAQFGENLKSSFRNRLENNTWLSSSTKSAAIDKLDYVGMNYGGPDTWPVTEMLNLDSNIFLANMLKVKEGRNRVIEAVLGKSINDNVFIYAMTTHDGGLTDPLYTYIPNASYNTNINAVCVFAPFMIAPVYDPSMEDVELYATLGTVIGHELTHGFDKEGATYDKYGHENDWWAAADKAKFTELNNRVIDHHNTFEIMPGLATNGEQTVTEDVADLGGFNIAYDYWVSHLEKSGVTGDELKEQKKKFFINYAKIYREKFTAEYANEEIATDEHSAGHIRVNAVVQQIDDWYELFNIKEGDPLYLAPEERITIW